MTDDWSYNYRLHCLHFYNVYITFLLSLMRSFEQFEINFQENDKTYLMSV